MRSENEKYRAARRAKGWTQFELAQRAGLHPSTISFLERGTRISPETAAKLDAAFGIEAKEQP